MGIKYFFPQCKKICGYDKTVNCEKITFNSLRGKRIAIDGGGQIFKYKSRAISLEMSLLEYYYLSICKFYEHNIFIIIIFDGEKNDLKKKEVKIRRDNKKATINRFLEAKKKYMQYQTDIEKLKDEDPILLAEYEGANKKIVIDYMKKKKNVDTFPTEDDFKSVITLLKAMNVPVFICNKHEAELFCVMLEKYNIVDYVCSEDTDVFMNGENIIINFMSFNYTYTSLLNKSKLMKMLGFKNNEQFMHHFLMYKTDIMNKINIRFYKKIYQAAISDIDYGKSRLIKCHGIELYTRAYRYFNPIFEDIEGSREFYEKIKKYLIKYNCDIERMMRLIKKGMDKNSFIKMYKDTFNIHDHLRRAYDIN